MKKPGLLIPVFLSCVLSANSQSLIIKGRIKCLNQTENSTKGAENIVVVPTFKPSRSTLTNSRPAGYFEFNTGMPLSALQDKQVSLYVLSRCTGCKEIVKRVFVSEDQDRQNRNDQKSYVTIKDWKLNTNCQKAELTPFSADSILQLILRRPEEQLGDVSSATAVVAAPAFLNFLTNLANVAAVLPNAGDFILKSFDPGKISYGKFLSASPMSLSANTGFNFSPSRDMSEAVFWNPSAIAQSRTQNNVSLLTNFRNNVKLGGYFGVSDNISIGVGGIYTMQDEIRGATYIAASGSNTLPVKQTIISLKEYAAYVSPVFRLTGKLSAAASLKSIWQNFKIPYRLNINASSPDPKNNATFTDSSISEQHFDVDASLTYKVSNALQVGLSLMNLAGTELYSDAFVPGQKDVPVQNLRSAGVGLQYKYKRWNFGADLLFTEDDLYDASIGVNYVPFNNGLISAGYAFKQQSYSLSFRMKHFRIAYINDNDWMVNEKRTGKSGILNGGLYGGFVFDFK